MKEIISKKYSDDEIARIISRSARMQTYAAYLKSGKILVTDECLDEGEIVIDQLDPFEEAAQSAALQFFEEIKQIEAKGEPYDEAAYFAVEMKLKAAKADLWDSITERLKGSNFEMTLTIKGRNIVKKPRNGVDIIVLNLF